MISSQNSHNLGLTDKELDFIRTTFYQVSGISRVRIFGSRAKGNWTQKSDIDIAYEGDISHSEQSEIWSSLTYDAPFLYKCDIVNYKNSPKVLQEHIDRVAVEV